MYPMRNDDNPRISAGIIDKYIKQMSVRPGYLAGRGATLSDLKAEYLFTFYEKIKEAVSDDAAQSFVKMVKNLKVASGTAFLTALYSLERNNWLYQDGNIGNPNYVENIGEATGLVFSALAGMNERDDTLDIVVPFLNRFGEIHVTDNGQNRHNNFRRHY